ncbi:Polyribonucleotide nucleotidyltransferase [Clarias magur]|uniref:Polyribonucleotide nucleotidyltransferase n=1 Tax=Clarias magur TaxID=1594786 RepID=A0A8J4WMY3_CLAMG|nr:Polyribonucleotide nucleotidyltransferase [Clarias magur]
MSHCGASEQKNKSSFAQTSLMNPAFPKRTREETNVQKEILTIPPSDSYSPESFFDC